MEHPYREVIIDFINLIVGASDTQAESDALWAYAKVPPDFAARHWTSRRGLNARAGTNDHQVPVLPR